MKCWIPKRKRTKGESPRFNDEDLNRRSEKLFDSFEVSTRMRIYIYILQKLCLINICGSPHVKFINSKINKGYQNIYHDFNLRNTFKYI